MKYQHEVPNNEPALFPQETIMQPGGVSGNATHWKRELTSRMASLMEEGTTWRGRSQYLVSIV